MTDRMPTDAETKSFDDWYKQGASRQGATPGDPSTPTDPPSGDTPWYTQVGRGLARGVASDIPGLSTSKFVTQGDAGWTETGARYVGEYGPMFIPGADFGLGAKFGTKAAEWALQHGPSIKALEKVLGPDRAQQMIEGLWNTLPKVGSTSAKGAIGGVMADPEHPFKGAATGAATAGAVGAIPKGVKKFATGAAATGTGLAGYEAARNLMHGDVGIPAYFAAHHTLSPLAALAASAALHRPGIAGAAGSAARKWWEGEDNQPPQQ